MTSIVRVCCFVALAALVAPAQAWASGCTALAGAKVADVTPQGQMNRYDLVVTVVNHGSPQASDTLQFVDVYLAGEKLDAKALPPLGAGQSYTVHYPYQRSADAGKGTTKLAFRLDVHQGQPACSPGASVTATF